MLQNRRIRRAIGALLAMGLVGAPSAAAAAGGKGPAASCRKSCADVTAPAVAIMSPSAGAVVRGITLIEGTAIDNVGVASVRISIGGGSWVPATGTGSWSLSLDTTTQGNGSTSIVAQAVDAAGNTSSATRSVTIDNSIDSVAPTIAITSPASGTTVDGTVTVSGTSADEGGVASVTAAVDGGAPVAASGTSTWSTVLDTTAWAAGNHTVTVRATDAAGNSGVTAVTLNVAATTPPGAGSDVVITDPRATGALSPLLRTRLIQRGDLTGVLYRFAPTYQPAVYFRDATTRATSLVDLPSDTRQGWVYAAAAMPTAEDLWIVGGNGPLTLRRFRLSGSPMPTAAVLVETRSFGDTDSRPGDLISLASGALVVAWHQQGETGPQGQHVAYRSPAGAWSQLPPLTFMPSHYSDQVVQQHPADGSIWLFANPDMWGRVGVSHLIEREGALVVDWTDGEFLSVPKHGLNGPDPENPDLAVAADPATGTVALAYPSADRRLFTSATTTVGGSRVAVVRIPAVGAPSFLVEPAYAEPMSDVGLVVLPAETVVNYHPIDEATLSFGAVHVSHHRSGDWEAPVVLGEGSGVAYASGRVEMAALMGDGGLHLFTF